MGTIYNVASHCYPESITQFFRFLFLPNQGFQSRFKQQFENDWLITVPVTKSARSLRRIGVDRWPALVIIIADPAVDAKVNGDLFLQHKVDLKCSRNLHKHTHKKNIIIKSRSNNRFSLEEMESLMEAAKCIKGFLELVRFIIGLIRHVSKSTWCSCNSRRVG
jgi:uncharacterized protein YggU (UPF0235/DUF167 family)